MATNTEVGGQLLRAETVDRLIKDLVARVIVMKQVVMVNTSSSWKETYWRETSSVLAAQGVSVIRSVPRLSAFPELTPNWTRQTSYLEKYGGTHTIPWEDIITDEIDVMARALAKISEAIAVTVDTQIWNVLTENQSVVNINTVAVASGNEWDSATVANRAPHQNILNALQKFSEQNINPYAGTGYLVLSPKDFANVMGNSALVSHPSWKGSTDILANGKVGELFGLKILVTNVVTADYAGIFLDGCGTWKEAIPLTTVIEEKPGISKTITGYQIGVCQLTTPKKVCLISNTQA